MFKSKLKKKIVFILILSFIVPNLFFYNRKVEAVEAVTDQNGISRTTGGETINTQSSSPSGTSGGLFGCSSAGLLGTAAEALGLGDAILGNSGSASSSVASLIEDSTAKVSVPVSDEGSHIALIPIDRSVGISAEANTAIKIKECVKDPLLWHLKQATIKLITASIVNWINTGFQGGPAFVTDLPGFLVDIADETVGEFIQGSDLAFLCAPFSLNVKIALLLNYNSRRTPVCTLSSVTQNINNAVSGLSQQWDWNTWLAVTTNHNNNAFGAYMNASVALNSQIQTRMGMEQQKLEWGSGFLSFEKCEGEGRDKHCTTQTPGAVIYEQLNEVMPSGLRELELADEIDEILGALFAQLMKQVIGPGGLLGVSSSSEGDSSYIQQMLNESTAAENSKSTALSIINRAINDEQVFLSTKMLLLENLGGISSRLDNLVSCYQDRTDNRWRVSEPYTDTSVYPEVQRLRVITSLLAGPNIADSSSATFIRPGNRRASELTLEEAERNATRFRNSFERRISAIRTSLETDITNSTRYLAEDRRLRDELNAATSQTEIQRLIDEAQTLNVSETIDIATDRLNTQNRIDDLFNDINADTADCRSFKFTTAEKDYLMCVPPSFSVFNELSQNTCVLPASNQSATGSSGTTTGGFTSQ